MEPDKCAKCYAVIQFYVAWSATLTVIIFHHYYYFLVLTVFFLYICFVQPSWQ